MTNSGNRAVRLPKARRFPEDQLEVVVRREGCRVIFEPMDEWPAGFRAFLGAWPEEIERPKGELLADAQEVFSDAALHAGHRFRSLCPPWSGVNRRRSRSSVFHRLSAIPGTPRRLFVRRPPAIKSLPRGVHPEPSQALRGRFRGRNSGSGCKNEPIWEREILSEFFPADQTKSRGKDRSPARALT